MKLMFKIKSTGEVLELEELRKVNRYGFVEIQYVLRDDTKEYRLGYEIEFKEAIK